MCGITGYISEKAWNRDVMISSLLHRGPDNSDSFNYKYKKRRIFIGHTRLKIIDLSNAGNQPMKSISGKTVISYNGEVYNFKKLKATYLSDIKFYSGTDTEVILNLYEKLGRDFVNLLEGDFAISILDLKLNKLFLFRDRLGVKPLYYYTSGNTLIFGSEIKAILGAGVNAEIDNDSIPLYFTFKYVPGSGTLFKNIKRLAPGTRLEYDLQSGSFKIDNFWTLQKQEEYSNIDFREAKTILRDLVTRSVNSRLLADVSVGNFLSGGLDSSIIAYILKNNHEIGHYCAKKSREDLKAEGTTSDFFYAKKLSDELNLNTEFIDVGSGELSTKIIQKVIRYSDDLIADGSLIPSYLITKEASQSSRVILSGMGADELFLGYAGHQLTLLSILLDKFPAILNRPIAAYFKKLRQGSGRFLAYRRYLHRIGKYYTYPEYKYGALNIVGDFENSISICENGRNSIIEFFQKYFNNDSDVFDNIFLYEIDNFLVKNLHYLDRMSMANSVESRVPYLDHRIVEFAFSLPRKFKLASVRYPKRILKKAFSDIPEYILKRRKAGFGMPLRSIFKDQRKIDDLINNDFLAGTKLLDLIKLRKLIENHQNGIEDNSSIIYSVISFQEWFKMYID